MSKVRNLTIDELNKGMAWIQDNLTDFVPKEKTAYWFSRCLEKIGGLLSTHLVETTARNHYWFRARAEESFSTDDHLLQRSFLHPPSVAAPGGRANIPNVPVLYVSEGLDESLLETGLYKSGKDARVALLEFNGALKLYQFYFPKDFGHINALVAKRAKSFFEPFFQSTFNYPEDFRERSFHLHRLICGEFLDDRHFFSSLIAYTSMYAQKNCDGVVYPGVKSLQMFNWALTTDVSMQCKVYRGLKLRCHADGGNEILEIGMPSLDGCIDWQLPNEKNMEMDLNFDFVPNYTPFKKPSKVLLQMEKRT